MYSDLYLNNRTGGRNIPRVFLVGLIAFVGLVASQVYTWYASTPSRASDITLSQHSVVNREDTSAGIFVETGEVSDLYVIYGTDPHRLTQIQREGGDSQSRYHLILLEGLRPDTTYHYKMLSEERVLRNQGQDVFTFTTRSPSLADQSGRQPVYGKVIHPEGEGLAGGIVLVTRIPEGGFGSYATITKPSGEWLVSLPSGIAPADPLVIRVYHAQYATSQINTVFEKAAPIPQSTVIGTDYTFSPAVDNVLPASTRRSQENSYPISLLYPEKDAIVPNTRPLFKGFGIPGTRAVVRVDSRPAFEAQSHINEQGAWTIEASRPFVPGRYTVTVEVVDNLGQVRTVSRSFTIAKSGEQVLGESQVATPSGTLTPSTRPSSPPSPTQSTVVTATPAPTSIVYVTATPWPSSALTSTPTRLEDAGTSVPLSWIVAGSLLLSMGVVLMRISPLRDS